MAVAVAFGIEGVSYQRAIDASPTDYPQRRVALPAGAAIASHVHTVFKLDGSEKAMARAIRPRLANPYVVVPDRYRQLFEEIETATRDHAAEEDETGRVVQSARALLLAMKADFAALDGARSALIRA
ncbi:MAG: hypothetical protein F4029_00430 [Gammaproteobacteria bacterium]|nr:hypothetical protein [Gammaproteobacteria bacterium]MYF30153.1 hypothetical protein [Gammaproteobacteria bacterium]MYK44676.1 hypothetical protein [Gammaproteobacteria bacterium]